MNISELIAELQKHLATHGDLDVILDVNKVCDDLRQIDVNAEMGFIYLGNAE